ncbi:MAG: NAD(P)/FAD-dependent oxidoreductase, partial [Polyangiaceae bacterium]|nr:NAD(P)/FAD-dependent oxidoreductase [Polyangiaceae bacterium]
FAALMERMTGEAGIGDRAPVLEELKLPQVLVWKDINEHSLARFLDRMSAKILRDLKREFPEAGAVKVTIDRAGGEGHPVKVTSDDGAVDERIIARARALWDAKGGSLTQIQM